MQNKIKCFFTILTLSLLTSSVQAYVGKDFASQRRLFLQVEADIKKGKLESYTKHKHTLLGYPLFPYLKYEVLSSIISSVKHAELSAFIKTYPDSPLSDKLRNAWLKTKAKHKMWPDFLKAYDQTAKNDVEMQCHYINATIQTSNDKKIYDYVPNIWLQGKQLPGACDPVLTAWKAEGKLTRNLIWQRIKLSIVDNNPKLARYIAKDLPHEEQKLVELWIRTNDNPSLIDKPHYFNSTHSAVSEMIVHAISKVARKNPQQAVKLWKNLEKQHKFNEHHWALVVKEIGLALSRRFDPNADKWLSSIPAAQLTKDVNDARLKLAVATNKWDTISKVYKTLPPEESSTDKWQYWYARALEMTGDREASQEVLTKLSSVRTYYGFMASMRLVRPYAFNHVATEIPKEITQSVLLKPAVIRAHELKQIGRVHTGRTEWYKALVDMDDSQRLAAAYLATEWDVPNWAIVALSKAAHKNDLLLRFPRHYSDYIHREAKNNNIDPEFLFAITRQESAFIPTAKSPVGALGLMQIMPNTGKQIAKVNRESFKHHNELLIPEKNIRFGSKYVRMMLDQHQQNPALAAASYNAGPHRVTSWLPEFDMPADSWIETIPFKETREYVQNVLTYAVIYQQILGKTPRMAKYMPVIYGTKRGKVKEKS